MLPRENYLGACYRFREKLRGVREVAQLTQIEVSRLLGKPQSFISKVEAGERRVEFVVLQVQV